ncbi:hypothetical protein RAS1_04570 [Phycisphaerae bacterium RAS1]|nr:hypothetical protein RAS1_04570 [Phycisphaerae bacterium RAS1]
MKRAWAPAAIASLVLLAGGWLHRDLQGRVERALGRVASLRAPLDGLPFELGEWRAEDIPLDPRVLEVANFDDAWVSRVYRRARDGAAVTLFVGYVGRARAHLGHRPDICMVAHGWEQRLSQPLDVATSAGPAACTLLEFSPPRDFGNPMTVMAAYLVNGRYLKGDSALEGWNSRAPDLGGSSAAAYIGRVQAAVVGTGDLKQDQATLSELLGLVLPKVAGMMPYWNDDSKGR